jgi:hypothetical protein
LLYVGDFGVLSIDQELYKKCMEDGPQSGKNCMPSTIKNTTDSKQFGEMILQLKNVIDGQLDRIVFPESVLEKLRGKRKKAHNNGSTDMKRLATNNTLAGV